MVAAKNLASERTRLGMTQEQLAKALHTTTKSISKYENDVRAMPQKLVVAAADLFGCSTDYLFGRTSERLPNGTTGTR